MLTACKKQLEKDASDDIKLPSVWRGPLIQYGMLKMVSGGSIGLTATWAAS